MEKSISDKIRQCSINIITTIFYFCWEMGLHSGVGYRSPRHWHTESFSPEIARLESQKFEIVNNSGPLHEITVINSKIEKLKMAHFIINIINGKN